MVRTEEKTILCTAAERLHRLLRGKIPDKIDLSDCAAETEKTFAQLLNELIDVFSEAYQFAQALSAGRLNQPLPSARNAFFPPFKQLQAQLAHLTRQAEQVAAGDYNQRVDFMGDFSKSFNSMVEQLSDREKTIKEARDRVEAELKDRTAELAEANEQLKRDITERRRIEKTLKKSNQQLKTMVKYAQSMAEETTDAKGVKIEFLARISHEIRGSMNAIIGFTELLLEEELTTDQHEFINVICESSHRLLQLVVDIIDSARSRAEKSDI